MRITKAHLGLYRFCSTDATRAGLSQIWFEPDGHAIATDGILMAIINVEPDKKSGPFGIPARLAKCIHDGLPNLPLVTVEAARLTDFTAEIRIEGPDIKAKIETGFYAGFPKNVRSIFPDLTQGYGKFYCNGSYLIKALEEIKRLTDSTWIRAHIPESREACAQFEVDHNQDGDKVTVLLMPCKDPTP